MNGRALSTSSDGQRRWSRQQRATHVKHLTVVAGAPNQRLKGCTAIVSLAASGERGCHLFSRHLHKRSRPAALLTLPLAASSAMAVADREPGDRWPHACCFPHNNRSPRSLLVSSLDGTVSSSPLARRMMDLEHAPASPTLRSARSSSVVTLAAMRQTDFISQKFKLAHATEAAAKLTGPPESVRNAI